jgi:trk system potassium uptake protein TrkH
MHIKSIIKILSILMAIIAFFMLIPLALSLYYKEYDAFNAFIVSTSVSILFAVIGYGLFKNLKITFLSNKDGFLLVSLSWICISLVGALPFYFSGAIPSYTDSFFETISGFTTTGASILNDIEAVPKSILFWRALTHWLGGMGIVVLTVAILPLLGIGGLQLLKAEAPGPTVDKITPRIAETAKYLWFIYLGMTVLETILLMFGGMDLFDAVSHSFATLATGGYSTKNTSIMHFNSAYIDGVITVFMVLAGINFTLHYRLLVGKGKYLLKDTELKAYLLIFFGTSILITLNLHHDVYDSLAKSFRYASFQVATILTTTGFASTNYEEWPFYSQMILFLLMFVGGCSGSTGGGIKVIRIVTLLKQGMNEMKYLTHPRGVFTLRMSGNPVKKDVVYAISGFFFLYIFLNLVVAAIVAFDNHDLLTSVSAALATVGNVGPGFGNVGPTDNYSELSHFVKWVLSFAMLAGRLEIYTFLVILTPHFWRK